MVNLIYKNQHRNKTSTRNTLHKREQTQEKEMQQYKAKKTLGGYLFNMRNI